ncbi:hypothetical protein KY290_023127 [Solanum tuberosum]|uniref:Uncharacterized protein n=1 Tax=Solanum tuberosum TaxID=4113 RepID=A0ABQ7V6A8_SOLTU|nr:hypothetical protein KY284_022049 [Solanum tuberosum]KAH0691351.1 hypothetical protein KY289_018709 [Solanum tuberosum]KAH0704198.1 hypothetical protein KY285_018476 [Solanum tuberosum]KAH0759634.1 hypothetical protein KY290_023127 [Solanum tuberosum]
MEMVASQVKRNKKCEVSKITGNSACKSQVGKLQRLHSRVTRTTNDSNPTANRNSRRPTFIQEVKGVGTNLGFKREKS